MKGGYLSNDTRDTKSMRYFVNRKLSEKNNELFVHNLSLNGEMYGGVYDSLKETFFDSSFTECIHLVEYNDICTNTEKTLKDIYLLLYQLFGIGVIVILVSSSLLS